MATRPTRRTVLLVESLEDRLTLSASAVLVLKAPNLAQARTASECRRHKKPKPKRPGCRQPNRLQVLQIPPAAAPTAAPPAIGSFFDVFTEVSAVGGANPGHPGDADRERAEQARRDAAGWRASAENDPDPTRREQKQNAAGNADQAANNWGRAGEARDKGEGAKADKLEEAARQRENAAREWGANGDSDAARKAEQAAQNLESQSR